MLQICIIFNNLCHYRYLKFMSHLRGQDLFIIFTQYFGFAHSEFIQFLPGPVLPRM